MAGIGTHGSLFSGIGGFDLASSWMGWRRSPTRCFPASTRSPC